MPSNQRIIFSIIIPAYNIAEYITDTLKSIVEQEGEISYEIIIVDDGSTDETYKKAKNYLQSVKNSVVIKQNNTGPGGARNRGLKSARGVYILFLDGDDLLEKKALQIFNNQIFNSPDMVYSNRKLYYEYNNSYKNDLLFNDFSQGEVKPGRQLLQRFSIHAKIYRREFLINSNISFPANMYWEDYPFTYKTLAFAKTINITPQITYIFRKRDTQNISITQTNRLQKFNIKSRFKQICMDLDIIYNSDLPKIFKHYNFYHKEFNQRLLIDIKYLKREQNRGNFKKAFKFYRWFLIKNRDIIFENISDKVKNIYQAIINNQEKRTINLLIQLEKKEG